MATLAQLETALRNAHSAGDTEAARRLAQEVAKYRRAGVTGEEGDPNEGMGFFEKAAVGLGRSAVKTGRGVGEVGLRALGMDERADRMEAESEAQNRLWRENAPGVARGAELAGDIGQFVVPASGAAKATQGVRMLGRMAAQAGAAAGTDALMQQGEGQQGVDLGRTALTAGFAGGGELAAPWLARAGKSVLGRIRSASNSPLEQGRAIAARAGIKGAPDDVLIKLASAADEIEAGADPGAVLAKYEFGFDVSRGQMTGSTKQIQLEEHLRDIGGNALTRSDARNIERMDELRRVFSNNLDSPANAMDRVQSAVQGAERAARQQADEAWETVRNAARRGPNATGAAAPASIVKKFRSRTQAAWDKAGEVVEGSSGGLNQKVHNVVKSVNKTLRDSIKKNGAVDFAAIVAARKKFGAAYKAVDPGSRAALGIARKQFDDVLEDLTQETLVRGSIDDIANMHKAIGHTREYKRLFENKEGKVGKAIMRMVSDDNIGELTQAMLGSSPVTRPAALNYVRAVKQVLGDKSPALDEFRRAVMFNAMTRRGAEGRPMRSTAINLKEMMHGKNQQLMKELFTNRELSKISRFTQALDSMTFRPGYTGRNSGTPGGLIRAFRRMSEGVPLIGDMIGILNKVSDEKLARTAMSPLRTNPALPAAPAGSAAIVGSD